MGSAELLEELFPRFDFRERHERTVAASAAAVDHAVRAFSLAEAPISGVLMRLRALPARITGAKGRAHDIHSPFLAQVLGPTHVALSDRPGSHLVIGLAGPMWQLRGHMARFADAAAFHAFDEPGNAKAVLAFQVGRAADGRVLLTTETRVLATDAPSHRRFALYWLVIRPWSGLIRREWLRAIARRAERASR